MSKVKKTSVKSCFQVINACSKTGLIWVLQEDVVVYYLQKKNNHLFLHYYFSVRINGGVSMAKLL